jgi:PHP family Zn ribbon phosphoesterase
MSPKELVRKLQLCGTEWFAITDHNSMANCPAYEFAAKNVGLAFSWGVEIQSIEEIHVLAYFDSSIDAKAFDEQLYSSLLPLDNDPDYFGDQVIIDENENILKVESRALINSSTWDLQSVVEMVQAHNGFAVPAHVDADVNSILSQLGFLPLEPRFELLGITAALDLHTFLAMHPELQGMEFLRASDAHYLGDLGKGNCHVNVLSPCISELRKASLRIDGRYIDNTKIE